MILINSSFFFLDRHFLNFDKYPMGLIGSVDLMVPFCCNFQLYYQTETNLWNNIEIFMVLGLNIGICNI